MKRMVTYKDSENFGKPKPKRRFLLFVFVIALLYSPKFIVREYNRQRPNPYEGFPKLNGVQVPEGPYSVIEKNFPKLGFEPIDLGRTCPISCDSMGNMILFIDSEAPPEDFRDIPRTGQYIRSSDGKYLDIGDDPAQLTVDGKLVQLAEDSNLSIAGKILTISPIRGLDSEGNMPSLFAAASGVFLNVRLRGPENKISGFTESGDILIYNKKMSQSELLVVAALREFGVFEAMEESVSTQSLKATVDGTVYGQSWAKRGIYQDSQGWTGRLCVLSENRFKPVPALSGVNVNTLMMVTAGGKVGVNVVGNCSYLTRPAVYDHGRFTLLPIPHGSISADLIGLADDGSAILQARHDTAWLFFSNGKMFPMAPILEDGPCGKLEPFRYGISNRRLLPEALSGLHVQNAMLSNGDILCQSDREHLVLLRKVSAEI